MWFLAPQGNQEVALDELKMGVLIGTQYAVCSMGLADEWSDAKQEIVSPGQRLRHWHLISVLLEEGCVQCYSSVHSSKNIQVVF